MLNTTVLSINATLAYDETTYQLTCGEDNSLVIHIENDVIEAIYIPTDNPNKLAALRVGAHIEYTERNENNAFVVSIPLSDFNTWEEYAVRFFIQEDPNSNIVTSLAFDDCYIKHDGTKWVFKKWDNYNNNIIKYNEYKSTPSSSVNSEVKEFALSLTKGVYDDYSIVKTLYNWICDNIYYDYDYFNGYKGSTNCSAYDTFTNRYAVCQGYANLMKDFCTSVGIPCKLPEQVDGLAGHVWNEAYVDGRWVIIDSTFGSKNKLENGKMIKEVDEVNKMHYFDMPLNNFSKDHLITGYAKDKDYLAIDVPSPWAVNELIEAIQYGLINDTYVQGFTKNITRGEFCSVIVDYITEQMKNSDRFGYLTDLQIQDILSKGMIGAQIPFVKEQNKITADIVFAYVNGIVEGKSNNWFDVDGYITREDACCMMFRMINYLNKLDSRYRLRSGFVRRFRDENMFSDYARVSIDYITKNNIMKGVSNRHFNPKGNITVEQTYLIFIRLLKSYK